ncbi:hypothetical protein ACVW0B_000593 [Thermostichus sp. MS-CIW-23]
MGSAATQPAHPPRHLALHRPNRLPNCCPGLEGSLATGGQCEATGLRLGYVFEKMAELGFDQPEDFAALEELSDPVILARLAEKGVEPAQRDQAIHVALYMRELADWIDEQLQAQAQISRLSQPLPKTPGILVQQSVHLT